MTLRPASTVCLLRDAPALQVLMTRRPDSARFMAGAWVFPGGAVDTEDWATDDTTVAPVPEEDRGWRAAGLRELAEEVGIWVTTAGTYVAALSGDVYTVLREGRRVLDTSALVCFANWITPAPLPVRFDTRFYATAVDAGIEPCVEGTEVDAASWVTPTAALEHAERAEWLVAFPTRKTLERLAGFSSSRDFLDDARAMDEVPAVQPRLLIEGGRVSVVLPGDPRFSDAGRHELDPAFLDRLVEARRVPDRVTPELR